MVFILKLHIQKGRCRSFSIKEFFSSKNITNWRNFGASKRSLHIEDFKKVKVYDRMPHFTKIMGANERALIILVDENY
jgi:hypothetical protein